MGQNQSEYILLSDLDKIKIRDSPPIKYLWFDIKINNEENMEYFEMFIKHFQVQKFWDFEIIKKYISSEITNDWDLRLICSASFSHQQYQVFQQHYKIKKILLFCSNSIRANFLKSNYSKITAVAYNPFQVINCARLWELQNDKNLYFYGIDHMHQLNNFLFKWKGFVSDVDRQVGKKNFIAFAKACCKNENANILEYQKYYDLKAEKNVKDKMITKWIFKSSFFFNLTSQTLKLSNSHMKLPYVRQPIFDIFSFIKANYSRSNNKSKKYYTKMLFSEAELAILNQNDGKICYFSTFLKASCSNQNIVLLQRQSLIIIQVGQKNVNYQCNGYFEYEQRQVVFNLGNMFKCQKSGDNLFIFELICLPKSNKNLNQNTKRILSHQFYINDMLKYLPHQCINFLLNDQPILACQYFVPKTKNIKTPEDHVKMKYSLVKIKIWQNKYHLCIYPFLESFKHLFYCKSQIVDDLQSLCKITKIAQMKWIIRNQLLLVHFNHKQFNTCQKIIANLKDEFQTKKNYDCQYIQMLLIEIFCEANNDLTSRSELTKILDRLTILEHQYLVEQKRPINLFTYTLFLRCKMFIFLHLKQFQATLKLIDQCINMIADCDGRNEFFNLTSQIKLQILQNLHIDTIKRQNQIKKQKCRSNISISELQNQSFHFKLNGLDFCLFD